jgi:hypothetical protein
MAGPSPVGRAFAAPKRLRPRRRERVRVRVSFHPPFPFLITSLPLPVFSRVKTLIQGASQFYAPGNGLSLTPCFSWVFSEGKARQPLQRFSASGKPLKRF